MGMDNPVLVQVMINKYLMILYNTTYWVVVFRVKGLQTVGLRFGIVMMRCYLLIIGLFCHYFPLYHTDRKSQIALSST